MKTVKMLNEFTFDNVIITLWLFLNLFVILPAVKPLQRTDLFAISDFAAILNIGTI